MPWVRVVYRRSELYEQVWKEPLLSVARHYGISDVALGKICRKLDVPVPGRGHWARTRAGQEIPRTPLPELKRGQPAQLQSARYTEPSTEVFEEDVSVRINKERDPRWSDGKRQRLEDQLNDFVAALIATAESLRLKAIEAEKERQRALAAEREREAAERQRAAMALLARDLHRRMGAWRTAQNTRSFVDLVKRWAATDRVDGDPRLKDWLAVAEWRIEALEKKARTELLDRRHGLSYASPLRQRFRWEDKASTAALVDLVLNPYSQAVDDPEDPAR